MITQRFLDFSEISRYFLDKIDLPCRIGTLGLIPNRECMTNKRRVDIYIDQAVWDQFTKKVKGFSPSRVLEVILQSIMGKDTPTKELYRKAEKLEMIVQKKADPPQKKKR